MDAIAHDTHVRLQNAFPLGLAALGETLEIVAVQGGERLIKRLEAMGLRPGTRLQTLQNERPGGLVVRAGGARLALGAGMIHKIRVIRATHHE